ncbi:MAG: hypothetical protein U1A24_17645 [Cypionkella sp.]|uniref:hypothetical protein n=1 Tax=Cypionkella sp. TaxID=2811411 RepID=UPI002ABBF6D3|nr:hypothetical protein [Cypionkella sp.]MDZ4312375.1 hypothetical protein [Cypionkella sp.]MDZ4395893.1 hypothetical protein [Cypionkella sp.]
MEQLLRAAGFTGVEVVDGVIYARTDPALPEFTATQIGDDWQLAQAWPLRATPTQIAQWNAQQPDAPMDIHQGETRITLRATPENLTHWADLTRAMVAQCVAWRRETRQHDEGM